LKGFSRLVAAACVALIVACAAPVKIRLDEDRDFSRYRTWSWLPASRAVEAPDGESDRVITRVIERELLGRGFAQVRRNADLRIGVLLKLRREEVTSYETGAVAQLSSMHSSPSYEIQGSVKRIDIYERCRLVVYAVDPVDGQIIWTGALEDHFRGRFSPHLEAAISSLVERFPRARGEARSPAPSAPPFEPSVPTEVTGPTFGPGADVSS